MILTAFHRSASLPPTIHTQRVRAATIQSRCSGRTGVSKRLSMPPEAVIDQVRVEVRLPSPSDHPLDSVLPPNSPTKSGLDRVLGVNDESATWR